MISVVNLSKNFGSKNVLTNIDLELAPGQVYGIAGENGAGKTTLFKCIAGMEPYTGTVTADKMPLKNSLGFLPAELFFFSKMTGREYLNLVSQARHVKVSDVETNNVFDLPLNQYVSTYSTGMKKKLAFTGILLQKNNYFIFDEPFNGVDIQSNLLMVEIILRLKKINKTILLSSHIFSSLRDTCDQIQLLSNGRITNTVKKEGFDQLETELKRITLGNKIDRLNLE